MKQNPHTCLFQHGKCDILKNLPVYQCNSRIVVPALILFQIPRRSRCLHHARHNFLRNSLDHLRLCRLRIGFIQVKKAVQRSGPIHKSSPYMAKPLHQYGVRSVSGCCQRRRKACSSASADDHITVISHRSLPVLLYLSFHKMYMEIHIFRHERNCTPLDSFVIST